MMMSGVGLAESGRVPSWSDSADESPRTEPEVGSMPPSGAFTMLPPPINLKWLPQLELPAAKAAGKTKRGTTQVVRPDHFEPSQHYYPRVLNAQIHPLVANFMQLGNERIIARYQHLNPTVDVRALRSILNSHSHHFRWAGTWRVRQARDRTRCPVPDPPVRRANILPRTAPLALLFSFLPLSFFSFFLPVSAV